MLARERVVRHLIREITGAAEDACRADESITADEVLSAYVTMARNVLRVASDSGADPRRLRAIVEQLMLECASEDGPTN